MIALFLSAALLTSASAQTCVSDNRLKAQTKEDFSEREDIQAFSKDGMWKMPNLIQLATEEELEDCASCTNAEVSVDFMNHQMGKLDGIKVATNELLLPVGSEIANIAPAGLGPYFHAAQGKDGDKKQFSLMVKSAAQKSLLEYVSHVKVLRDIEKSSTSSSGVYLVLSEGFKTSQNFAEQSQKILSEAPKDWDILFLSTGPNSNHMTRCEDKLDGMNLYEMRRPRTTPDGKDRFYAGGIDGYLVRKQSVPKILSMLQETKAAPLTELLMSVHSEEKERLSNGKINYKVEGIYSYMVTDKMLDQSV